MLRCRQFLRVAAASPFRAVAARSSTHQTAVVSRPSFRGTTTGKTGFMWSRNLSAAAGDAVRVISDLKDYEEACKANEGKLIVAYHTAAWCGPCKRIWPHVQELASGHSDVAFLKIDVDECQDVAAANRIEAMPTFLMIKDGQTVEKIVGAALDALLKSVAQHK